MKQGLLLVDKPEGWTSFDVVNYVRKIVAASENKKPKNVKVGHSGTLDPFATGLLILLIGKEFTRKASLYTKKDKVYEFSICLGKSSATGDKTGEIVDVSGKIPTKDEIKEVLSKFTGEIQQTPPQYSAIKVKGKKAYEIARSGETVYLEARNVRVYSLELMKYDYPKVYLKTEVSSGTYVRSLAEDIGVALGTGAYTDSLRRTSIDVFSVDSSVDPKNLTQDNLEQFIKSE